MINKNKSDMPDIKYTLIRTRRKSIELQIGSDLKLTVRAPLKAKESVIDGFVRSKAQWISKKQFELAKASSKHADIKTEEGGRMLYLGDMYAVSRVAADEIQITDNHFLIPERFLQADVVTWFKCEARRIIAARAARYSIMLNVSYTAIRITDARSRWGSCSGRNSLCFTWRLAMCPVGIIDYVVVHELCHILHKNHSRPFWDAVGNVLPDYAARRKWLNENRGITDIF